MEYGASQANKNIHIINLIDAIQKIKFVIAAMKLTRLTTVVAQEAGNPN